MLGHCYCVSVMEYDRKEGAERLRIHPLEGQTDLDGRTIDHLMHVSCSREIRSGYPAGTIFYTFGLDDRGTHYVADRKTFGPVVTPDGKVLNKEYNDLYQEFLRQRGGEEEVYTDLFGTVVERMTAPAKAKPVKAPEAAAAKAKAPSHAMNMVTSIRKDPAYAMPTVGDCGFWIDRRKWEIICRNLLKCKNTLLTGPTGTGKTQFVRLAAQRLGLPFHWYDMGITKDPVGTLIGTHRIEDGRSVFDWADFARQIQQPGVILLDELSRAVPMALNILFPCLDGRRTLRAEMAGGSDTREIRVHPQCCFVATANIGDEYTGVVDEIDAALKNRFFQVEMDTIPAEEEQRLLRSLHGIGEADARNIVTVADNIRRMHAREEICSSVSTRDTLECAELIADGYTIREALELKLLPLFHGTDSEGDRSVVRKTIMSY